jgi:hypothetical protein
MCEYFRFALLLSLICDLCILFIDRSRLQRWKSGNLQTLRPNPRLPARPLNIQLKFLRSEFLSICKVLHELVKKIEDMIAESSLTRREMKAARLSVSLSVPYRTCLCMSPCLSLCLMSVSLSVWMSQFSQVSLCLSLSMSVCLYVCMFVCLYACMPVSLYVCMSVCLYVCMSVCLYVCLFLSVDLSVGLSVGLSVCHPADYSLIASAAALEKTKSEEKTNKS